MNFQIKLARAAKHSSIGRIDESSDRVVQFISVEEKPEGEYSIEGDTCDIREELEKNERKEQICVMRITQRRQQRSSLR